MWRIEKIEDLGNLSWTGLLVCHNIDSHICICPRRTFCTRRNCINNGITFKYENKLEISREQISLRTDILLPDVQLWHMSQREPIAASMFLQQGSEPFQRPRKRGIYGDFHRPKKQKTACNLIVGKFLRFIGTDEENYECDSTSYGPNAA